MSHEISFLQKMLSSDSTRPYSSLGSLIKDYRKWQCINQEKFAESVKISVRELQNWEANRRRARLENLHDLSEFTGIPMQALVALNADQPIWYSLQKRMFNYSLIENTLFSTGELFKQSEKTNEGTPIKVVSIKTDSHVNKIFLCHRDIYGNQNPLPRDVIKAAAMLLPSLNNIVFDCWGHYVGHEIYLPIKINTYQKIKKQKGSENYLATENISDVIAIGEGVIFCYSCFTSSVNTAYQLVLATARALSKIEQKSRYMLACHAGTTEAIEIHNNLGMRRASDYVNIHNETISVINEIELDVLMAPSGPIAPLLRLIEQYDNQASAKNLSEDAREKELPAMPDQEPSHDNQPAKKKSAEKKSGYNSLINFNNLTSIANKKSNIQCVKSKTEACTNPKCILYGKTGKNNIISNGTYQTKKGIPGHRFQCKECGKSFCSRTGTFFYDFRSPEEKVLRALILLAKGVPLLRVAKLLGVKFDTIRQWLEFASQHNEKIDAILINEPDISRIDLDALWAFARTKSLRQRALIYRTKNKFYTI